MLFRLFRSSLLIFCICLSTTNCARAEIWDMVYGNSSVARYGEWLVENEVTGAVFRIPIGCHLKIPAVETISVSADFGFTAVPSSVEILDDTDLAAFDFREVAPIPYVPYMTRMDFIPIDGSKEYLLPIVFDFQDPGYLFGLNQRAFVPLPGDATNDGKVDQEDRAVLKENMGQRLYLYDPEPWRSADFNADGRVNLKDAAILRRNMGTSGGAIIPSGNGSNSFLNCD